MLMITIIIETINKNDSNLRESRSISNIKKAGHSDRSEKEAEVVQGINGTGICETVDRFRI